MDLKLIVVINVSYMFYISYLLKNIAGILKMNS